MAISAFEQIVAEHGPTVWRVCRAVVGANDADDAWSDTFLAALIAFPRLRPDSNIRGWLVTIAHHKAIDRMRAAARAPSPVAMVPERPTPGMEYTDEYTDRDSALWAALAALPPKQRMAVTYHHVAGLPYAHIAALLDITEVAARRRAADGIASLRNDLNREDKS